MGSAPAYLVVLGLIGLTCPIGCFRESGSGSQGTGSATTESPGSESSMLESAAGKSSDPAAADETRPSGNRVKFVDVSASSGLDFTLVSGSPQQDYIVAAMAGGVAFFDYDNDGYQDVFMVSSTRMEGPPAGAFNRLYKNVSGNDGGRVFRDVTEGSGLQRTGWGMGCATGDYDNDGDVDIYVTYVGPNALYRNNSDGTFANVGRRAGVADERWGASAAFADVDGDGHLDLYVANYLVFDPGSPPEPRRGWKGLVVFYGPDGMDTVPDALYRNNGDGTFADLSARTGMNRYYSPGLGVVFGDYDNDGDQDIYVANDGLPNLLFRNEGDWRLTEVGTPAEVAYSDDGRAQAGMGTTFGDYDNDGDADLFVTNYSDDVNTLYQNQGGGFFMEATFSLGLGGEAQPYLSWSTNFFDYDNDSDLDLFVVNGHLFPQLLDHPSGLRYPQRNLLYANEGGRFQSLAEAAGPGLAIEKVSRGGAFGDYDNDGDVDLLITNLNDTPDLLRNEGGNHNNWVGLELVGTTSNRDAIGARVQLFAGGQVQTREVRRAYGYQSQHDPRLIFGLASLKEVDRVEIRWPSGRTQTLRNLPLRRYLVVREGSAGIADSYVAPAPAPRAAAAIASPAPERPVGVEPSSHAGDPSWTAEEYYLQGEKFYGAGRYGEAMAMFADAVRLQPDHFQAYRVWGATLIKGLGDYQGAVELLSPVVGSDSTRAELYDLIAMAYMGLDQPTAAIEALERATALDTTEWKYYNLLGRAHIRSGDFAAATAALQRASRIAPSATDPHLHLSRVYGRQGRRQDARQERHRFQTLKREHKQLEPYLRRLEENPGDAEALYRLAVGYTQQRRYDAALKCFKRLAELTPGRGMVHYGLGIAYHNLGKLEEAIAAYNQAYRLDSRLALVFNDLGRAYQQLGRLDEALAAYRRLIQLKPGFALVRSNLGEVYALQGKRQQAIEAYREALALESTLTESRSALARLYAEAGRLQEAIREWQVVVQQDPGHPTARTQLQQAQQRLSSRGGG